LPPETNGRSAGPPRGARCFVCDCERAHGAARAIAATYARTFTPRIRRRPQSRAHVEAVHQGAPESVLLPATSATAACFGGAASSLVAVSSRTAPADPHSQAVGIVRPSRVGERRLGCAARAGPTGLVSSRRHLDPCMRFSRTRLSDVLHRRHSAPGRHGRYGRGATMVPSRLISPSRSGDWWMTVHQPYRLLRS
jgi:hypothetical protein